MLDRKEIDIEIARLEYGESSYPAYAKLANLYTIREQMERQETPSPTPPALIPYGAEYSKAEPLTVPVLSDSEFFASAADKDLEEVLLILDDLLDTLRVTNPRAYSRVLNQIREL